MMIFSKVISCGLAVSVISLALYHYKGVGQEDPTQWTNKYSPDEIKQPEAVAIVSQIQQEANFTVFHYDCSKENAFNVLYSSANEKKLPQIRLIESRSDKGLKIHHFYTPHDTAWGFIDVHGTNWTIEPGQMTGRKGQANGLVCKFNLEGSADATSATTQKNYLSAYGA